MILCLLLAALLGFIIGYLLGRGACPQEEAKPKEDDDFLAQLHNLSSTQDEPQEKETEIESDTSTPQLLSSPRGGKKDNLTRIKGIGVKIEKTLNDKGIYHFDQIAKWTEENIQWVDANIAFPGRVERENWVEQAKLLAAGEETEFSKRVDAGEVSSSKKS